MALLSKGSAVTEQPLDTEQTESEDNLVTLRRSQIKSIERKAKERDQMAADLETAQRRLAFAEAGIPLGDKRMGYFIKGYDGPLEADAIREAAIESGFVDSAPPSEGQTTVDEQVERQNLESVYAAGRGQQAPPGDIDGEMSQALADGGSEGLMRYLASKGVPISED